MNGYLKFDHLDSLDLRCFIASSSASASLSFSATWSLDVAPLIACISASFEVD